MRFLAIFFIAMLDFLAPASAQARARDDVMSSAFHCSGIADTRQWLDCYYGAAQPVRAQLGLQPAPADQIRLTTSPPMGGTVADETIRDEVMSNTFRCNSLADDRQWLDCYYGAAQPVRAQLGLSPAPQAHALPAPSMGIPSPAVPAMAPPPQMAKSPAAAPADNANHIGSNMVSYSFDHDGFFTVKLANGQVWRQHSTDINFAQWTKPAATYAISISRGFLGNYSLQVQGSSVEYKVDRLK
jgi:hypothetical protein